MAGGRPPKSIKDHELNGNPSKLDLQAMKKKVLRLPFDPDSFKAPAWIKKNKIAKKVWKKTVQDLTMKGVLAGVDLPLLAGYCMAYAQMVKAGEFLNRMPDGDQFTKITQTGYLQVLPQVGMFRQAAQDVKSFGDALFCTPVSRQRGLGSGDDSPGNTDSEMDGILNQARDRVKKNLKVIKGKK
jgi:P27 family predicted phage terminase small subunit